MTNQTNTAPSLYLLPKNESAQEWEHAMPIPKSPDGIIKVRQRIRKEMALLHSLTLAMTVLVVAMAAIIVYMTQYVVEQTLMLIAYTGIGLFLALFGIFLCFCISLVRDQVLRHIADLSKEV